MIYNIKSDTFDILGQGLRNGDLVAVCNAVEYLRQEKKDPTIQFYMPPKIIHGQEYCHKFFSFLTQQTNYFSLQPSDTTLSWKKVMLWDFRDISGDLVKIPNTKEMKNKLIVFPIYDAQYNTNRNWNPDMFTRLLLFCNYQYPDHEKIVCAKDDMQDTIDLCGFEMSTDFLTNVNHILDAEVYIGGDTGMSHFASALDRGPKELIYYYNSRGMIHTLPFYALEGKGKVNKFWMNFEGTTF